MLYNTIQINSGFAHLQKFQKKKDKSCVLQNFPCIYKVKRITLYIRTGDITYFEKK